MRGLAMRPAKARTLRGFAPSRETSEGSATQSFSIVHRAVVLGCIRAAMPTPDDFRRLALAFPDVEERSHMGHPDFRVGGKVFATLAYPAPEWGRVRLMPEQQADFMGLSPAFEPVAGAWGRSGNTLVRLAEVDPELLETALRAAWRERAPTRLQSRLAGN